MASAASCRAVGSGQGNHIEAEVRQVLFESIALDGSKVKLGVLIDGRCAVWRAGDLVHIGAGDEAGIAVAVTVFLRAAGSADRAQQKDSDSL